jgi:hypothetical protein
LHNGPNSTYRAHVVTGPAIYHFGIIDFLQNWTLEKRIERLFKIYILRKDPDGLSVMHPHSYKARFQGKMQQILDMDGQSGGIGMVDEKRQLDPHDIDVNDDDVGARDNNIELCTLPRYNDSVYNPLV